MTAPAARGPLAVEARGVGFRYATSAEPALHDLTFRVEPGSSLLIVGPSGSGKSTLARAIAGLLAGELPGDPTGSLVIGDASAWGHAAGEAGILFQDPGSQLVMDRVGDDVAFGLENRDWPREAMLRRVPEALSLVQLDGFEDRRAAELSGGEQQRVALAGVLAPGPGVLVLDEPTANLDPSGADAVFDHLDRLRAAGAITLVIVEHHVDRAWPLADQVLALDPSGGPIDVGPPTVVLARSGARLRAAGVWLPDDAVVRGRDGPTGAVPVRSAATSAGPAGGPGDGPTRVGSPVVAAAVDLTFAYPVGPPILAGLDLEIRAGDRIVISGANGSGKSTLGRLLAGLARPLSGEVSIRGAAPWRVSAPALASLAGYAPQDPELALVGGTVAEDARLGLDADGAAAVPAVLERLGLPLERFGGRSPYRLSGGEQRRLSLVPALVRRPALLVLDEPTFGLDRRGHDELVAILTELSVEGTAVVAASHDERFAARFAGRRLLLSSGRLADRGPA
jgi:energy-coupling factor transporter ATP-binding protein EcfA2